jgi:hypothetical protein
VCPILEYEASGWDLYRVGQIKAIDYVQKKVDKFANRMNDLVWEILAQHRKIARICTLFTAYTGEQEWKSTGDRLKGPCYISRDDHDCVMARWGSCPIGSYGRAEGFGGNSLIR